MCEVPAEGFLDGVKDPTGWNVGLHVSYIAEVLYDRVRKVDIRQPGKGDSNSHGARQIHQLISKIKWVRTSRLTMENSLYRIGWCAGAIFSAAHLGTQLFSTVFYVNRGATFILRRSTLDFCLGGQAKGTVKCLHLFRLEDPTAPSFGVVSDVVLEIFSSRCTAHT